MRRAVLCLAMLSLAALACNLFPGVPVTPTIAPTLELSPTPTAIALEPTSSTTATYTPTPPPTATVTALPSLTNTPTLTRTATASPSLTSTATYTATATPSLTSTPTATYTRTAPSSPTAIPTATHTLTALPSLTNTQTTTYTPTVPPSLTSTRTATYTLTALPSLTNTLTATHTLTALPSPINKPTDRPTLPPIIFMTVTPRPTVTATVGGIATGTPFPTFSPFQPPTLVPTRPLPQPPTLITTTPGPQPPIIIFSGPSPMPIVLATATPLAISVLPTALPLPLGDLMAVDGGDLQLPPSTEDVVAFDISREGRRAVVHQDGRMTIDGSLYVGDNKHTRQQFVQARWSPDGNWLAYIVQTPNAEQNHLDLLSTIDDGVWVLEIHAPGAKPTHILRNYYIQGSNDYPFRVARSLAWAPDDDAILVTVSTATGTETILTGKSRQANEDLPGLFDILHYNPGTWLPNGVGWVATTSYTDQNARLGIVNRYTAAFTLVLDGLQAQLWMQNPALLPDGRYAFLGKPSPLGRLEGGASDLRLYVFTPGNMPAPVSEPLPGEVFSAEWSPGRTALLVHLRTPNGLQSVVVSINGTMNILPNSAASVHWR